MPHVPWLEGTPVGLYRLSLVTHPAVLSLLGGPLQSRLRADALYEPCGLGSLLVGKRQVLWDLSCFGSLSPFSQGVMLVVQQVEKVTFGPGRALELPLDLVLSDNAGGGESVRG